MRMILLLASLLAIGPSAVAAPVSASSPPRARTVEVTYLANEGFLIVSGEHKILVDALFPGIRFYPKVPQPIRSKLERAVPPFDGVDLVLASHFHDDHFGALEVARFLEAAPATFISTPQAVEKLRAVVGDNNGLRASALFPAEEGRAVAHIENGIRLTVLNLHHGRDRRPAVQNLGFIIDLDGFRILHIGDTEADRDDFAPHNLHQETIDLALLPGWFLTEERWIPVVRDQIKPGAIAVMHLATPDAPRSWFGSAGSLAKRVERIRQAFPDAWVPLEPLASKVFSKTGSKAKMPAAAD